MNQPNDRAHDRRRLAVLAAGSNPQDRVLVLTGRALAFVLLLTVARCAGAAVSTVEAELGPARGRVTAPLAGGLIGEGAVAVVRPRQLRPPAPSTATGDGATDTTPAETQGGPPGTAGPPPTFAAPPRQGRPPPADDGSAPAPEAPPAGGEAGNGAPPRPGAAAAALQARLTQLTETTGGWFAPDSTRVGGEAAPILDEVAALLRQEATARVEIGGHTDTNGSAEENLRLSQARADAVREELVGRGVAADRLVARGYGQTRPRSPNDTVAGRASNRRIELTVLG